MNIPSWREREVRLGNPGAWKEIYRRYNEYNPQLPFAILALNLPDLSDEELEKLEERLEAIHDGLIKGRESG